MFALLLLGCTATTVAETPTPSRVILYHDTLTVEMSDGVLCTGVRRGGTLGWSGTLDGCPYPQPFRVERSISPVRMILSEGVQASARAVVTLHTVAGPVIYSG